MVDSPKTGTQEFGDLLRNARERKGMSRNDLVDATGLSYPYVSQLETAYRKPSPAAIQKLADALDISLDDIFAAMTKPAEQRLSSEPIAHSGWIANESFVGSPVSAPAPRRFAAAENPSPPPPPAPAPAPAPPAAVQPATARSAGVAPMASRASVVEQVVDLLTGLPAEQRLDALAQVQAEVVSSVIADGRRQGGYTS